MPMDDIDKYLTMVDIWRCPVVVSLLGIASTTKSFVTAADGALVPVHFATVFVPLAVLSL